MALYHWNNGSPRKAKVSGSGNRQKYTLPDGSVMTGKISANPDLDLYNYAEVGPAPGEYQKAGGASYSVSGDTIIATRAVLDIPLEQAQSEAKRKVKAKRDQVQFGGTEWVDGETTHVIQTDAGSQAKLTGAVVRTDKKGAADQSWRMADNSVVTLNKAKFDAMATAVGDHVDACYTQQAVLEAQIDAAADVDAIRAVNIDDGWPSNPTAEGA